MNGTIVVPSPSLVVLVGPAGAGKSTFAAAAFAPHQVVSSDALRALTGEGEHDLAASRDAFAVLEDVVDRRLRRSLTTVVDSLALDAATRERYRALAAKHDVPCIAVLFDVAAPEVRRRNRARTPRVPDDVLRAQLQRWPAVREAVAAEPFAAVHDAPVATDPAGTAVAVVPANLASRPARERPGAAASAGTAAAGRLAPPDAAPARLRFGLQVPSFTWPGGPAEIGPRLRAIAVAAEEAGFDHLWVMDHVRQIPVMGPAWHDMLESTTTLGHLAAATRRIRLGALVHGVTYRNVGLLGKAVATLDVLSGGRANCGLGLGWFRQEHEAYGFAFPPVGERYALLEDALQLLPLLWGPGSPRFEGAAITVPEAMGYPRPLQARVPLLVGGSGERRTLRLVARYADACNLFGEAETVRRKVAALHRHCEDAGRDPSDVEVTQLSTVLAAATFDAVAAEVARVKPARVPAERFARRVNAGTVEQHVARFEELLEAGVQTAIVSLSGLEDAGAIERFSPVLAAFRN